jgi:hypothetical protein
MVSNTPLTCPVPSYCRPVQVLCIMTLSLQMSPSTDISEVAGHSLWDYSIIHQVCSPRQRTWCYNCILFLLAKSSCNMLSLIIPYYFSFVVCLKATRLAKLAFAFFYSTRILNFHFSIPNFPFSLTKFQWLVTIFHIIANSLSQIHLLVPFIGIHQLLLELFSHGIVDMLVVTGIFWKLDLYVTKAPSHRFLLPRFLLIINLHTWSLHTL